MADLLIDCCELGMHIASNHDSPASKLAEIESMKWLTKGMKNIVGTINDVVLWPYIDACVGRY